MDQNNLPSSREEWQDRCRKRPRLVLRDQSSHRKHDGSDCSWIKGSKLLTYKSIFHANGTKKQYPKTRENPTGALI